MNREELFYEWFSVCNKITMLNSCIQNDFDSTVSIEDRALYKKEFVELYEKNIKELENLKSLILEELNK